jgi:2-polyprenyl-3-methyl-5-hydroxy-6-metoxy-1,4-benzoquinol methylase
MKGSLMLDYDPLEEFRDPQTYDLVVGDYNDDRPCIEQWARARGGPLLDLACGTGRMAIQMAQLGYEVVGVDLVPEMIALARQKADAAGVAVEWVVADARAFRLDRQFPCIFMLENVFQFLLTRPDQEAMLARVREHLRPDGWFIFETRNPSPANLYQVRHPEPQHFTTPDGRHLVTTDAQHNDPLTQIQHYTCRHAWRYPDGRHEEKALHTALRYVYPREMEALLHYNGFEIVACYGDWQQAPLTATSPAMIYVCRRRPEAQASG